METMANNYSLTKLIINVKNIVSNYNTIKDIVGPNTKVAATVKANCYGLGIEHITQALSDNGCDEFYVATLDEGIALRKLIPNKKIFILTGVNNKREFEAFNVNNLIPVLNSKDQIKTWEENNKTLSACLHVDTGMTRLGLQYDTFDQTIAYIEHNKRIKLEYILSHLACADDVNSLMNKKQLDKFKVLAKKYPQYKYSFASSGGVFLDPEYYFDQVRPGIFLYGVNPNSESKTQPKPVVTLKSQIIQTYKVQSEETIGYGGSHKLTPGIVTATIPIGYADGYLRRLASKVYCYIEDIKVPLVGRISMDAIGVDISSLPESLQKIGTEVTLIGDKILVETIATMADTISYEILTSIGSRYRKEYVYE